MAKKRSKSVLSKGFLQVRTDYSNISVDYREHDSRNGRLLVHLDDNPVDASILREVADRLEEEEKSLREGRARYADMAATHAALADSLDDEEDDTDRQVDSEKYQQVIDYWEEVAYRIWDSGCPGAGAGHLSLLKYEGRYYLYNDPELYDCGADPRKALLESGILEDNKATEEIWVDESEFGDLAEGYQ